MWRVMFVVYLLVFWVDLVTHDSYGRMMYGWILVLTFGYPLMVMADYT